MPNSETPELKSTPEPSASTELPSTESPNTESFDALFAEYEKTHPREPQEGGHQIEGVVVAVTPEQVFVDIGFKIEGVLSATETDPLKPGDRVLVSVKGRNEEGYYSLSRFKVAQPKDWTSLEKAFHDHTPIPGRVTSAVKGGFSVDVGVRAFMPASRSGARDAAEMEKLVDQEIVCRIIKLDVADEDVVVDRRVVLEEEARSTRDRRYAEVKEGEIVTGTVRSLADYGAFIDLGGVDGLLHVGEISWTRIANPADVLKIGQQIETKVLRIDPEKQRISLGMKQLQPHPWDAVPAKYSLGQRVTGVITRTTDFGAFVELEPGIEGLIHISEMAWGKKVRKPTDVVKPGETVEAVILGISAPERRLSLGLKQAFGDPWAEAARNLLPGSQVEGPIVSFTNFGAFLQVAEGVEGMIHISEISAERRLNHPSDALHRGERVKAQVLSIDSEKRQLRLSIKKLVPTGLDEFLAEHKPGDVVTGRLLDDSGDLLRVELGEGIIATARAAAGATDQSAATAKTDLSSLTSMLQARWKGGSVSGSLGAAKPEPVKTGQIRSFRIAKLDVGMKRIELDLV
ncbi:MAG: S1 RNA-binding domain-containing protein [Silvibacterium sp.]|nr:S1 RNA-binding domain-containing protein [Silvibacterium sp.]MBV8438738.1 S1 RNA-binding domain-containing protein [Silvibacterium sp.]